MRKNKSTFDVLVDSIRRDGDIEFSVKVDPRYRRTPKRERHAFEEVKAERSAKHHRKMESKAQARIAAMLELDDEGAPSGWFSKDMSEAEFEAQYAAAEDTWFARIESDFDMFEIDSLIYNQ